MNRRHQLSEEQLKMAEELLPSEDQSHGFVKHLYFGHFISSKVMPYPEMDVDEAERLSVFMEKLRSYMDKHLDPDWIDRHAEIPMDVIHGLGDVGLLGMTVPTEYGGQDFSQLAYCEAVEELASRCASTAVFVNAHHSIGLRTILLYGTEKQRRFWLPDLCSGRKIAAFALTEKNAGSDISNIETTARYLPEIDSYEMTGSKRYITNGSIADVLTVMAKTEVQTDEGPKWKVSAFLISPEMEGFKIIERSMEKCGIRGTLTARLQFDKIIVPSENLIGSKGAGLSIPLSTLNFGRITFGSACTGAAKFALKNAIDHSQNRIQFDRPIGSFPMIKKKISRMAALTYAMDATTKLTAGTFDRNEDIMLESAITKVFVSDSLWEIINDTIQIFGGKAFFCNEPYERMMRDARLNSIGEGANEVLTNFIGLVGMRDVGLELAGMKDYLSHPGDILKGTSILLKNLAPICFNPTIPIDRYEINSELHQLEIYIRRFAKAVKHVLFSYREGIVDEQLIVERIASMVISIYTTTAVLIKINHQLVNQITCGKSLNADLTTAKYYCILSFENIDNQLASLFDNSDNELEQLSDLITGI
ncbi:MAG: acyl-CoA dehydrogenase family protein [Lentisphaeria bacterium]|nr:acyl-CoA dehydrogenase family protein [Lentisphaeria bacterium]NQZ67841.1 acyl-CoA dehydrogenase family protein [Lentisphaeria bacterium]